MRARITSPCTHPGPGRSAGSPAPECEKITLSGGALKTEPIVFQEVDILSHLLIDDSHIYVCGSAVDGSGHKVFVYDSNGALQMTLADSDGSGLGSITFITQTANGYLAPGRKYA